MHQLRYALYLIFEVFFGMLFMQVKAPEAEKRKIEAVWQNKNKIRKSLRVKITKEVIQWRKEAE